MGIVVEPPKSEEATTDNVVNGAMENDAETAEISEESSNCENSVTENVVVDVDDELCPDELHYPEIDGKIAFICFQCEIEIEIYPQECEKCGKRIIGLGAFCCSKNVEIGETRFA